MPNKERPLADVPLAVLALFTAALAVQIAWHALGGGPRARVVALSRPPPVSVLRVAALGEPVVLAKGLMLWLQAHDDQPGVSIPFRRLDYRRVEEWLARILTLDPRGQYPLLAASRVYAAVENAPRERSMLDFVYREFLRDPNHRWRWLATAVIRAKYHLHDMALALRYARAITAHAPAAPFWARDMSFIVLQDMGELQAARIEIGGLLASGKIHDAHELRFLRHRLREIAAEASKNRHPVEK